MPELKYVLDKMCVSGFQMPVFISYDKKTASADTESVSYESNEFPTDSQANVWMSGLKLASNETLKPHEQKFYRDRIYAAADRYGIRADLEKAAGFVDKLREEPEPLRTEGDWLKARDWLVKFAAVLDPPLRISVADMLLEKSAEVGYILSYSDTYELRKLADKDPVTPEMKKYAESLLHTMPSGRVYSSEQFGAIPYEEAAEYVPDLVKAASLGMPVMHAHRFAKVASQASKREADAVELLLSRRGVKPLYDPNNLAIEVNDEMLAAL
jgi:hypothetical protein